jgi:hypothetical protein
LGGGGGGGRVSVELGEVEQVVVRESGEEPILLPRVESLSGGVIGPGLVALGGDLGRLMERSRGSDWAASCRDGGGRGLVGRRGRMYLLSYSWMLPRRSC